ncbi:GNAT family N-acetyltransferase [Elizabethkingia miricola]|uniref:GNAT family N-acetyltransferase n=1 Tax=Elizabethkingia miricola TaxID=172045 RepID=UPI002ACE356C|nr:hypothetical protein [Elizabethkingia miricola]WQM39417.1 hypothetical protein U2S95_03960 [Elizabethkingia miricola]
MELFKTERLIIRRFRESDAEDLFEYFEKPRVNCFMDEKLNSIEDAKAQVKKKALTYSITQKHKRT